MLFVSLLYIGNFVTEQTLFSWDKVYQWLSEIKYDVASSGRPIAAQCFCKCVYTSDAE